MKARRVPLAFSCQESVRYGSWPVTQGIPFADGELPRGEPVCVVDSSGRRYPTQSRCLATWREDLRFVKWLLLDFRVDAPLPDGLGLSVEYGTGAEPPAHEEPVRVGREGGDLRLETGPLCLELRGSHAAWRAPRSAQAFGSCRVRDAEGRWRELWSAASAPYLSMTDGEGVEYRSDLPGPAPRLTVEEEGPLRSSVCIQGHHSSLGGTRLCPYVLRLHLYAGSADLRIHHTFIFDQDPHAVRLSSVAMVFPIHAGWGQRAAVAGGSSWGIRGLARAEAPGEQAGPWWARRFDRLEVLQADDRTCEVRRDGVLVGRAERTSGWASLCGPEGSCLAVLKDSWQEYPKALTAEPSRLTVGIWPEACGRPLEFTTPFEEPAVFFRGTRDEAEFRRLLAEHPTAPLNLKSLDVQSPEDLRWVERMLATWAPGRAATHNDTGTDDGTGAARTTEIHLRLSGEPLPDELAEAIARAVQEPVLAPAAPAYACATRAFGHFLHAGDPRFAAVDQGLDLLFESVAVDPIERCRLHGMMRNGNMVCSHSAGPAVAYVARKDTDPEHALDRVGPYNNETNDQIMAVWGNFLRTGGRLEMAIAQRYSRAVADVAIIHAHPSRPEHVGLMHYHNCHQWSGGPSPSHTLIAGILTDYYLTGNRRLLDVALEVADRIVRSQEPCGILSNRSGALHREFLGPLWCLLDAWQATWTRKYGDLARRSLSWFLRVLAASSPEGTAGWYPVSVYTRGERGDEAWVDASTDPAGHARDVYHLYEAALRLFPSPALRRQVIAEADFFVNEYLTDNFITAGSARRLLTARSRVWKVDGPFYWTQWGASGNYGAAIVALAYELTGELRYAAYARDHLFGCFRRQVDRARRYADWRFTWIEFGSYIPRVAWVVARALERDAAGLERAAASWKAERERRGNPVYEGPGVDLDRDVMDPNGNITSRLPDDIPRENPGRPVGPARSLGVISAEDPQ